MEKLGNDELAAMVASHSQKAKQADDAIKKFQDFLDKRKEKEAAEAEAEKAKMETDEVESKRRAVQAAAEEDRKRRNLAADVAQAAKDAKDGKPPGSG